MPVENVRRNRGVLRPWYLYMKQKNSHTQWLIVMMDERRDLKSNHEYNLVSDKEETYPKSYPWALFRALAVWAVLYIITTYAKVHHAPITPLDKLVNAREVVFNSSRVVHGAVHVPGRRDIDSWFYDLGGSTCACTLQWDQKLYLSRLFYGVKYVAPHCATAFLGVLFLHRIQWVLLYKLLNEVLEEASLTMFGKFALTEPVFDIEPRYDSLLQDIALAVVPFGILAHHLLYVAEIPDVLPLRLHYDVQSFRVVLLRFLEFYAVIQSNNLFNIFGTISGLHFHFLSYEWNAGKLVVWGVQLVLMHIFDLTRIESQTRFLRVCLTALWAFFVIHRESKEDEQIQAMLSFSVVGCLISLYQVSYSRRRHMLSIIAMFLYAVVFILYLAIESIVPPPTDKFYYRRKWCGLSDHESDSCSRIHD